MKEALVVAPHADDEVLGVGGTIFKMVNKGWSVDILVVTKGFLPLFDDASVAQVRNETLAAHKFLGVRNTYFLDLPAAQLDQIAHSELNASVSSIINKIKPDVLFIPFVGDIHNDHQLVFVSCLVSTRPTTDYIPRRILAYETLSETYWNSSYLSPMFAPNVFIDISDYLDNKIEAMKIYASQLKDFPQQRSVQAIKALAELRGSTINVRAAESFVLIRDVIM